MSTIALIGTGGTISMVVGNQLELRDYRKAMMLSAAELLDRLPVLEGVTCIPVPFEPAPSNAVGFALWKALVLQCDALASKHPEFDGIVISHGTASLEETAWFLNLTLKIPQTVVLVGSQRPASAFGTDAGPNLLNALRVAAAPQSRGRGVLVMLNDEIHAAREVTKTATFRLQTFRSPDFGVLGHVDGDRVSFYRRSERRHAPETEFDIAMLATLPRVDISYSYADADGAEIAAFVAAGAKGIVSAGFAPGIPSAAQLSAMNAASATGVQIVQSSRAGSGIVHPTASMLGRGTVAADNLNPQKARILLALALTLTNDREEIARMFSLY